MKSAHVLAIAACLLTSNPLIARSQSTPGNQAPTDPAATAPGKQEPTNPTAAAPPEASSTAAAASQADMQPVSCELVSKLDSKTAKTGDSVVVKTRSAVKTTNGLEIPKGSKLVGRITAVKSSGDAHENSQVALQFDSAELKGGSSVPIHSEIKSLSPAGGSATADPGDAMAPSPSGPAVASSSQRGAMSSGSGANASSGAVQPAPTQPAPGEPSTMQSTGGPAPGTVVARTGDIAIRTTSIPGVMLASNEPGQQDPRMGQASGILLGAKQDIRLDGGTQVVVAVASTGSSASN
ncbi:MAG TPA: hypothetical protein VK716_17495 [Terracidiphilus sp.]|jgi:hypothetical protein|nr:hypothetical protein [Terracidiphilus sp.]